MTAEEFIKYIEEDGKYTFGYKECMQKFAKQKCKELLLLVAEKARIDFRNDKANDFGIDKDSILNAVDLEKFCS